MPPENPPPFRFVYQDESGEPAKGDCGFVIGLLLVRERQPLLQAVAAARARHHFPNELHFHKFSGLRERVYRSAFEEFAKVRQHFEFRAIVLERKGIDLSEFGKRHLAYNFFTAKLLLNLRDGISEAVLYADEKSRMREDNFLTSIPELVNSGLDRVALRTAESRDSKGEPLLQITDLLTGCANAFAAPWRSKRKAELSMEAMRLGLFAASDIWIWNDRDKK